MTNIRTSSHIERYSSKNNNSALNLWLSLSGESVVNEEIKNIFPSTSTTSTSQTLGHQDVLARADRLLTQLRKKPASLSEKHVRRRRKHTGKSREYQRNLVVIDYPGKKPPAVQVLHDYDKVYEGSLSFTSAMSEDSIREEIAQLIQEKISDLYDFTSVEPNDFEFVKCVNKRVRAPDGKACYDGDGIRDLYRCANIYVRLTKSFSKYEVRM
jgi:hypothetical protein